MSKRLSKMGWIVLAALLCLSLIALPACTTTPAEEEEEEQGAIPYKNPGIFVQETIGDVDSFDPAWAYDTASGEQLTYIYETLMAYDGGSTSKYVPVLCSGQPTISGANVTYHVASGIKFSNGDPVTAEDVKYSIERAMLQDRDGGPGWMFYLPLTGLAGSRDADSNIVVTFSQVDNQITVSGSDVTFHLVSAGWVQPFQQIMVQTWASILDKQWCKANGDWDGTEATWKTYNNPVKEKVYLYNHAMGTGPWTLATADWDSGISITLHANAGWHQGTPPFNSVVTKIVDEWSTRKTDFVNGDADRVDVPRQYIDQLSGYTDLQCYKDLPALQCDAFFFNFQIKSDSSYIGSGKLDGNGIPTDFFTDPDLRKAFCYSFNYATFLADAWQGEAIQLGSPVVKGLPYYNPNAPMYSFDENKAKEYFQKAWGGQVWTKGFKFTLLYNSGNVARQTACTILANELVKINKLFLVSIQPVPWSGFTGRIVQGTMPMWLIGWLVDYPDPDDFVFPFQQSTGTFSGWQHYSNAHVDDLIAQGEATSDTAQRQAIYYELQQLYYDDAPGIMLEQPTQRTWFTPFIHGFYFNPTIPGVTGPLWKMSKSNP